MLKRKVFLVWSLALAIFAVVLTGCENRGRSTLLKDAANSQEFSYQEKMEPEYLEISESAERFAAAFAAAAGGGKQENFAVSPVSVYAALSLAAECADGTTREEILSALGLSCDALRADFPYLYRSLNSNFVSGKLITGNSVWVNEGTKTQEDCLQSLSDKFFCTSYMADFAKDNGAANDAVRHFVKDKTNGLIDKDFDLSTDTYFALINTLYLKDSWNTDGNDLPYTDQEYTFTKENGEAHSQKFLRGYYFEGRAYEAETFTSFFTATAAGFRIKFLLPKEGYALSDVFTAENLALANGINDYRAIDETGQILYKTRCLFPEFHASYDQDVRKILKEGFGIDALFDSDECDLSNLIAKRDMTGGNAFCYKIQHVTDLTVDKKGIEGAAVTVVANGGESAPYEYETVRQDFVADRPFGYIVTNRYGTTLFSGAVYSID